MLKITETGRGMSQTIPKKRNGFLTNDQQDLSLNLTFLCVEAVKNVKGFE